MPPSEKMRKVSIEDHKNYIPQARANTANKVYPCSIAEGFQRGDIFADDDTGAVLFWHYCGFGYISGEPSDRFLHEIFIKMISPDKERRLVLITDDWRVEAFFRDKGADLGDRIEFAYRPGGASCDHALPEGITIARIDGDIITGISGRIVPSFSWESDERFLRSGFGYAALDGGKVCAVAFSSAVSSDEVDIGVETDEAHRRMGLASALTSRMCDHILNIGKKPVWANSSLNFASWRTAEACGFVRDRVNTFIKIRQ